jgi:predicted TIM-barrel fold metal-dependent hydrolase
MIIDFHAHVEYKDLNEKYSAHEFIQAMDMGGIDKSVILGNDQSDMGSMPPWANAYVKAATNFEDEDVADFCRQYPERLVGFTSIHPDRYLPHKKIERAIKEFGMKGVKLYPHSGFYPNNPRLDLVYQKCEDLSVPVMIHTGPKAVRWQYMKYNNPVFIDDVATNFPGLKIIISHGGYPWVEEFMAVVYSNENIIVDITFLDYIEKAFRRSGLTEETMRRLVELIGPRRLVWGSEGPFMNLPMFGVHGPEYYVESQEFLVKRFDFLSEDDKKDILGNNAMRILRL